ncbi:MAG: polysaccharide lyase family 7 protein [Verrucomicrobia bacterium]|nr:polysaccharide lyase family 7 protein [Verrucomicrobiota bacterium]MCH8527847.1 putative Ig domain-containing protein [Kiritimatiellia bacterium]
MKLRQSLKPFHYHPVFPHAVKFFSALFFMATYFAGNAFGQSVAEVPFDLPKFQPILSASRLHSPSTSPSTVSSGNFGGYELPGRFYLGGDGTTMVLATTVSDNDRSELRHNFTWPVTEQEVNYFARLRFDKPVAHQEDYWERRRVNFVQIYVPGIDLGPVVLLSGRLRWGPTAETIKEDHLWMSVQGGGQYDLGPRPEGFFDVDVRVKDGEVRAYINDELKAVSNLLGFDGEVAYFKTGAYHRGIQPIAVEYELLSITAGPDRAPASFTSNIVNKPDATAHAAYHATIADDTNDPENDQMIFIKTSGPDWLNVAPNGALSGIPSASDVGANSFTVDLWDSGGNFDSATLEINVAASSNNVSAARFGSDFDGFAGFSTGGNGTFTEQTDSINFNRNFADNSNAFLYTTNSSVNTNAGSSYAFTSVVKYNSSTDIGSPRNVSMVLFSGQTNGAFGITLKMHEHANTFQIDTGLNQFDGPTTSWGGKPFASGATYTLEGTVYFTADHAHVTFKLTDDAGFSDTTTRIFSKSDLNIGNRHGIGTRNRGLNFDAKYFVINNKLSPTPPTGLFATADESSVSLDWADSPEGSLVEYSVYRSNTSGSYSSALVTGLSTSEYVDNNVVSDTTYYYVVTATDIFDRESAPSSEVSVTTPSPNQPPVFTANPIVGVDATEGDAYTGTLAGSATDPDVNDTLSYAKVSGPAWLSIAANGDLSGTPGDADVGLNSFTVEVSDGNGGFDQATLEITVSAAVIAVTCDFGTDPGKTTFGDAGFTAGGGGLQITNGSDHVRFRRSGSPSNTRDGITRTFDGLGGGARNDFTITAQYTHVNYQTWDGVMFPAGILLFAEGTTENALRNSGLGIHIYSDGTFTTERLRITSSAAINTSSSADTFWQSGSQGANDGDIAIRHGDVMQWKVDVTFHGTNSMTIDATLTRIDGTWERTAEQLERSVSVSHTFTNASDLIDGEYFGFGGRFRGSVETRLDTFSVNSLVSTPPVADAGPDQMVTDSNRSGSEDVTLDGSGSSDADGSIVSYLWTLNDSQIATGVTPTVSLPVGTHVVTLTVTDNDDATDTDTVTITVNAPPVADAGGDQTVTNVNGSGSEDVTLDGSDSSDADGNIVSFVWTLDGSQIATGVIPTVTLPVGTHMITLTATDNRGATDSDTVTITVNPAPAPGPGIRVTEYHLTTGDFTGTTATLTLDQNLADDYYILVRGSRVGDGLSLPDNDYARVTAVPGGKGDLPDSGTADQITLGRWTAGFDWEGVVTVVESENPASADGFRLVDVLETSLTGTSGTASSAAWTDLSRVVLFGGYRGGGAAFTEAASHRNQGTSVYVRLHPSGTDTLNWSRDAGGETLRNAVMTTFVVEWGDTWTVQHVNVAGANGGNGANHTSHYTTAAITAVNRDNTWVWGTGTRLAAGIGTCAEACLITLGDGVSQNTIESTVAVGSEYTNAYDFDVYVLTHPAIAVDHVFVPDGNTNVSDLPVSVAPAAAGARFGWVYNGVNGTGDYHPRSRFWARYTADNEITISRGFSGQPFPAWVQGVDFSDLNP